MSKHIQIDVTFNPNFTAEADPAATIHRICIIGDSQIFAYNGILVTVTKADGTSRKYPLKSYHCPDTHIALSSDTSDGRGALQPGVLHALRDAKATPSPLNNMKPDCSVVFSTGSYQLNHFLYRSPVFKNNDFVIPGQTVDPAKGFLPARYLEALMRHEFDKQALPGFFKLFRMMQVPCDLLLPLPPPHLADDHVNRPGGPFRPKGRDNPIVPLATRFRLYELFQDLLETTSAEAGFQVLDGFTGLVDSMGLKAEYEMDGLHPNRAYALEVAKRIVATIDPDCNAEDAL